MKRVIKINGLHVNNAALPVLSVNEIDKTLAQMPGIRSWFDPTKGTATFNEGQLLDRASGQILTPTSATAANQWSFSTFENGAPAFLLPDAVATPYKNDSFSLNPTEWTIAAVVNPSATAAGADAIVGAQRSNLTADDIGVQWVFQPGSNLVMYTGLAAVPSIRVQLTPADVGVTSLRNLTALYMVTFSTQMGLTMWYNGKLKTKNITDLRPLTVPLIALAGYEMQSTFGGRLGHIMIFDVDLSKTAYTGYCNVLSKTLMGAYGLTS